MRFILENTTCQTILLDLYLPDGDGIDLIEEVKELQTDVPIIIITAHGSIEKAVEAMQKGAYDFCPKPLELNRLKVSVKNALESLREENSR